MYKLGTKLLQQLYSLGTNSVKPATNLVQKVYQGGDELVPSWYQIVTKWILTWSHKTYTPTEITESNTIKTTPKASINQIPNVPHLYRYCCNQAKCRNKSRCSNHMGTTQLTPTPASTRKRQCPFYTCQTTYASSILETYATEYISVQDLGNICISRASQELVNIWLHLFTHLRNSWT